MPSLEEAVARTRALIGDFQFPDFPESSLLRFYDRDLQPIPFGTYLLAFNDVEYQRVAYDEGKGWSVSTVWMGTDLNHGLATKPFPFETLIESPEGTETMRWSDERVALAAHQQLVDKLLGDYGDA